MNIYLHFFSFSIFHSLIFNLWVIQLCGVVSQLALSDPPAWVQTSHLCPLTWPAPCCTTCPTIMACCHATSTSPASNDTSILLGFPETSPESLLASWPSSSAQVLVLLLDASEVQLEILFNGFVLGFACHLKRYQTSWR